MEWWSGTFKRSIGGIGRVVLVALPWKNPTTLWEIFCAIEERSKFDIALNEGQRQEFFQEILSSDDAGTVVDDMLGTINSEKSKCFKDEDRHEIFKAVRKTKGGFHRVNALIFDHMRDWVTQATSEEYESEMDPTRKLPLLLAKCELLRQQGKYKEAEPLCIKCYDKMKKLLGDTDRNTLRSLNTLAALYESQGRYEEAEPLCLECLDKRKAVLGETHPDTFQSLNNVALLYFSQGRYEEAEPLYRDCLYTTRIH
jgi:tetratricopeptide (TPR) repeat protein